MTLTHHQAPYSHEGYGAETKFIGPEQGTDHHIPACA